MLKNEINEINLNNANAFHQATETVAQKKKELQKINIPSTITFKLLNKKHPEYNTAQLEKLELLYNGGDQLLSKAKYFLPKEPQETVRTYSTRIANASYKNIFAQICNDLISHTFSKGFNVTPVGDASRVDTPGDDIDDYPQEDFYKTFFDNCDLNGSNIIDFERDILRNCFKHQKTFTGIDALFDAQPLTLEQQKILGTDRLYIYHIDNETVFDYQLNDDGSFRFIKLVTCFPTESSVFSETENTTYQCVWWIDHGNTVECATYSRDYEKNTKPRPDDLFTLKELKTVSFNKIPIRLDVLPVELWIGNLICNLVIDHFKLNSSLNAAVVKGLNPIPVCKLGPEMPVIGGALNTTQSNVNRGESAKVQLVNKGFVVLGKDDSFEYVEPEGKSYEVATKLLDAKQNDIYNVVNQMGQIAQKTQRKESSGYSKQLDLHNKEITLSCIGDFLRKAIVNLYNDISFFHKDNIKWQVIGLTDFKVVDKDQVVNEAKEMNNINIPSKTWKKIYTKDVACELLYNLSPSDELTIKQEIDEAIDKEPLSIAPTTIDDSNKPLPIQNKE